MLGAMASLQVQRDCGVAPANYFEVPETGVRGSLHVYGKGKSVIRHNPVEVEQSLSCLEPIKVATRPLVFRSP
jgi:hypothetical protein